MKNYSPDKDGSAQGEFLSDTEQKNQACMLSVDDLVARLVTLDATDNTPTMGESSVLSAADTDLLSMCEQTVRGGLDSALAAGMALLVISQRMLYRATHASFASYIEGQCVFSRSHAYRLIRYAKVCSRLSPIRRHYPNEQQVRDMLRLRLSHAEQYRIWQRATFKGQATRKTFDQALIDVVGIAVIEKLRAPRPVHPKGAITLRYAAKPEFAETIKRASARLGLSLQEFLDAAISEKIARVDAPVS